MEVVNYNDKIRNFILTKLDYNNNKDNYEELRKKADDLYKIIEEDENKKRLFIGVMYLTSYIVNYIALKKYPEDENLKNDVEFLKSFSSVDEFIYSLDDDIFFTLCQDTALFASYDYYSKKMCILKSIKDKNFILKMFPFFVNDIVGYCSEYTPSYITDYYYKRKLDVKDENVAMEDAVCFGVEFLIKLEKQDPENYEKVFDSIIKLYYTYNKYLLSNGLELDYYAEDTMSMIENDIDSLKMFSINNGDLLEPIVRDFLSFSILPIERQKEIFEAKKIKTYNPNIMIRKKICNMFKDLDIFDEECADEYQEELEEIKESEDFDKIVKVLYIDSMSNNYFEYLSLPNDEDVKLNYEYMKDFSNIDQFKMDLLENDMVFLMAISDSIYFHNLSLIDKKQMINTMINEDAYSSYIIDDYLSDIISYNRNYNVDDAYNLYKGEYLNAKDKKIAIARATKSLKLDLMDLEIFDKNNYNEIMYDISKIFYEYNKYLFDNNLKLDEENINIISIMESNLDNYFEKLNENDVLIEKIINSFYEYLSLNKNNKQDIDLYFKNLEDKGNVKIFNKKNKNSN